MLQIFRHPHRFVRGYRLQRIKAQATGQLHQVGRLGAKACSEARRRQLHQITDGLQAQTFQIITHAGWQIEAGQRNLTAGGSLTGRRGQDRGFAMHPA